MRPTWLAAALTTLALPSGNYSQTFKVTYADAQSLTLPNNANVKVLAATLLP